MCCAWRANTCIRPDLTIVAVGKTDEFGKSLATLGLPVSSIDLTIPESRP